VPGSQAHWEWLLENTFLSVPRGTAKRQIFSECQFFLLSLRSFRQIYCRKERDMQARGPEARKHELEELALIYENRGLDKELAMTVAEELTQHDVIRAHARDELGIDMDEMQNPIRAAYVSALACTLGASIPLLSGVFIEDEAIRVPVVVGATAVGCFLFGSVASALGGAGILKGGLRVFVGGILSMGITYGIGKALGTTVGK
jgi:VIT1/CCC1 family predicted Fe2+/Mn2+ transporter